MASIFRIFPGRLKGRDLVPNRYGDFSAAIANTFFEGHMIRYYIVPIIGVGTKADPRRPKYASAANVNWAAIDFGLEPVCFVAADVNNAQHTALAGYNDVIVMPVNLDAAINVSAVTTALEKLNIPATWIDSFMTYRSVIRTVVNMFLFMQRLHCVCNCKIFGGAVVLDTTRGALTTEASQGIADTAASMGLNASGMTGASTLRAILKNASDQMTSVEITLLKVTV